MSVGNFVSRDMAQSERLPVLRGRYIAGGLLLHSPFLECKYTEIEIIHAHALDFRLFHAPGVGQDYKIFLPLPYEFSDN